MCIHQQHNHRRGQWIDGQWIGRYRRRRPIFLPASIAVYVARWVAGVEPSTWNALKNSGGVCCSKALQANASLHVPYAVGALGIQLSGHQPLDRREVVLGKLTCEAVDCSPRGCAAPGRVPGQGNTPEHLSKLKVTSARRKIIVTCKSPVGDISAVTLIRTDTTLDHSQKAEKVC